jgi:glyceraldehyde 3-phosphate dehydrogenase
MKIAINGFGRIGRCFLRAIFENNLDNEIEVVAINTPGKIENCLYLLKYDSVHGIFNKELSYKGNTLKIGDKPILITHEKDITNLDWKKLDIDVVIECTGIFNTYEKSFHHIKAGARKVLVSAPMPDPDCTIIYGVNNNTLKPSDKIISVGSCTTNCLAPMLSVVHKNFHVEKAFMTTIHSYTNDQNIVDNNHKKDLRRARACALSMIPTTTGAAKTINKVIPELNGKIDGVSIRVPTPNVSLVDLTAKISKGTSINEINNTFFDSEKTYLKNILQTCAEPLVSIDFNHNPHSCIIDLEGTHVIDKDLIRIAGWYDNEWGFSARMIDILKIL